MGLALKRVISSGVHSPVYRWWVLFEFGQPSGHPSHTTIIPSILALYFRVTLNMRRQLAPIRRTRPGMRLCHRIILFHGDPILRPHATRTHTQVTLILRPPRSRRYVEMSPTAVVSNRLKSSPWRLV